MSLGSTTERAPSADPSTVKWIGVTIAVLILGGVIYSQLVPFAEWIGALLPVERTSSLFGLPPQKKRKLDGNADTR